LKEFAGQVLSFSMREDKDSILMQIDKSLLGIEKVQSYLRKREVITQYTLPYHFNMNSVDERSSKLVKTLLDVCYWELTFLNLTKRGYSVKPD